MRNQIQRLKANHHRMVDLFLLGFGNMDVAREMGMSKENVSLVVNSPLFQDELARRRVGRESKVQQADIENIVKAKSVLENAAVEAARTHVGLLNSDDDNIKQRSASAILDRVGLGTMRDTDNGGTVKIDAGSVNLLVLAMKEEDEEISDRGLRAPVVDYAGQEERARRADNQDRSCSDLNSDKILVEDTEDMGENVSVVKKGLVSTAPGAPVRIML